MIPYPSFGDPEHKFFSETTTPSISLIGAASLQMTNQHGGRGIQLLISSRRQTIKNIEALRAVHNDPAPTTALHSDPLPTDEAELFAKVVPEAYTISLTCFQEKRLRTCLLIMSLIINSP